jgi:hypothetical protein
MESTGVPSRTYLVMKSRLVEKHLVYLDILPNDFVGFTNLELVGRRDERTNTVLHAAAAMRPVLLYLRCDISAEAMAQKGNRDWEWAEATYHASHTFSKLHALVSFLTDFIPYLLHPLSLEFEKRFPGFC